MNQVTLGQLFGWPNLRHLCGKPAASWSINDQIHAEAQDLERKRIAAEGQDSEAVTSAVAKEQERHARHVEQLLSARYEQSAIIMENVRKISRRPNSTNNATLCMQIFGVQWNGAVSMCERMGLDPKKVGK